jgi:GT2 family glycosyltransferase
VLPDSTHNQDIVTAVIVGHDGAAWLPRVVEAVASQTRPVQRVVAVDTGSRDRSGAMLARAFGRAAVFGMDRNTGYGAAVAKALRHRAANVHIPPQAGAPVQERTEWVWLLHDDCEPAPDALENLLSGARQAPTAVLGPKVRDWSDRHLLLEAGVTIDRVGRRVTGVEPREADQGQHDGDRDVLAVSSAGMLARRDVWDQVGGFDPGMRLFREDVDFCWRVQQAGHRVRVITGAVVYHVEASARNRRPVSAAPRPRRQDRRNALLVLAGNLPSRPMIAALAGNLVLSSLRTMFFLLAKRPRAALDELAAYASVTGHPLRLLAARRRRSDGRQAAYARLSRDIPPGRSVSKLAEYAASTLSRSLPAEAVGSHHATEDPSDDDSLLVDSGLVQRLLTNPGVLLFLVLTVIALVAERSLLGGTPLGGGALVPAWGGASGLWQEYLQGFHPASIGTSASTPPYVALVALLATLLGGKPWLAVDVILLGCIPLAGISAFLATRRVTRFMPARVIGAFAYALLPVGMGAVAAGRLGTAVLLVLLPPAGVLIARIFAGPARKARRAAWATALLVAVIAAFVPLFWLMTAVTMTVGVATFGRLRRGSALNAAIVIAVPLILLAPWIIDVVGHPAGFFLEAGVVQPGLATVGLSPRSLLLLSPGGPGLPPFWVTAGIALAAAVALLLASSRRPLVLAGWAVGVLGLITAAAVSRIAITQAGQVGPSGSVPAWPGPALAVAGAGLLLAAVAASDRIPGRLRSGQWRGVTGFVVIALGVVACSAPALAAAYWLSSGVTGPVGLTPGPLLPEFVSVSAQTGQRLRTLVLQTAPGGGIRYEVLRSTDPLLGSQELALPTASQRALSLCVATLTAPFGSAATDQGRALASFGIGYVMLPAPVNGALARLLDGVPGLRPVSVTSTFQLWRVIDTTAQATVVEAGGKVVPVPSGPVDVAGARAPAAGGTLILAEPYGGWSATLNGRPLTPLPAPVNGWAQGFRLPSGGGVLSVSHSDAGRDVVVALEVLAVLIVAALGLPGARMAGEARAEIPAAEYVEEAPPAEEDELVPAGRRGRRRDQDQERSRRRHSPRRGRATPEVPREAPVRRPAVPAQATPSRGYAVPAGARAAWPHRAEEADPGAGYPGGGSGHRRGDAGDPAAQTAVYRAQHTNTGRHGYRGEPRQPAARGPATDPGQPRQDGRPPGGWGRPGDGPVPPPRRGGAGPPEPDSARGRRDYLGSRRRARPRGDYPDSGQGPAGETAGGPATSRDAPDRRDERYDRFALPVRAGRPGRSGRRGRGSHEARQGRGGPPEPSLPPDDEGGLSPLPPLPPPAPRRGRWQETDRDRPQGDEPDEPGW